MNAKDEQLHIRASVGQKAILAKAAQSQGMSVSQFVLRTVVPVAEKIVEEESGRVENLFRLGDADWEEFNRLLDAPTQEIPSLRELLSTKAPWEQ